MILFWSLFWIAYEIAIYYADVLWFKSAKFAIDYREKENARRSSESY